MSENGNNKISFRMAEPSALTDRQLEIVKMYCDGLVSKEIASKLGLSVKTVETHKVHIFDKVFNNIPERNTVLLVRWAMYHKIVEGLPKGY